MQQPNGTGHFKPSPHAHALGRLRANALSGHSGQRFARSQNAIKKTVHRDTRPTVPPPRLPFKLEGVFGPVGQVRPQQANNIFWQTVTRTCATLQTIGLNIADANALEKRLLLKGMIGNAKRLVNPSLNSAAAAILATKQPKYNSCNTNTARAARDAKSDDGRLGNRSHGNRRTSALHTRRSSSLGAAGSVADCHDAIVEAAEDEEDACRGDRPVCQKLGSLDECSSCDVDVELELEDNEVELDDVSYGSTSTSTSTSTSADMLASTVNPNVTFSNNKNLVVLQEEQEEQAADTDSTDTDTICADDIAKQSRKSKSGWRRLLRKFSK